VINEPQPAQAQQLCSFLLPEEMGTFGFVELQRSRRLPYRRRSAAKPEITTCPTLPPRRRPPHRR
jgi:hypothetical protein